MRVALATVILPAALVGAILLANAVSRAPNRVVSETPAGPSAPLTVRLDGPGRSVRHGQPIGVTLYALNHTNRALPVRCSPDGWHLLVVSGGGLPARGYAPGLPCPATELAPGASRFDLSLATTSLPAGTYRVAVAAGGLPPGSALPPGVTIAVGE